MHWGFIIAIGVVAWIAVGVALALIVGRIISRREAQIPSDRTDLHNPSTYDRAA